MRVTFVHHSCFLVETDRCYYLFDYEKGDLPEMDGQKPIFVLSSHGHGDHYNEAVFSRLEALGMETVRAVLSDDIKAPPQVDTLSVCPGETYRLGPELTLTTLRSTDLGVAFLLEDRQTLIYHAGDLNDWVWDDETEAYNTRMTEDYRRQIQRLGEILGGRTIDVAFVVLDPRQEKDYARGMCYFLEHIPVKQVYPMHTWQTPSIIETFLRDYPTYAEKIRKI